MTEIESLRLRMRSREQLSGLVIRIPSHQVVEILAASTARRPDLVMIDTEHAAIDPGVLDAMLGVAAGSDLPALVRVSGHDDHEIQRALDSGATGIVVPHVDTPERAALAVRAAHYGDGGRGYSPSTRSAGFGQRTMEEIVSRAAAITTVIVQIEDPSALDRTAEIVVVPGVDGVLFGRADLAVAFGAGGVHDHRVLTAGETISAACHGAGVPLAVVASSRTDADDWVSRGASIVFEGTDQQRLSSSFE